MPFLRKREKQNSCLHVLIFALAVLKKKENPLQFIETIINKFFSHLLSFQTTRAIPSDKRSLLDLDNTEKTPEAGIKI